MTAATRLLMINEIRNFVGCNHARPVKAGEENTVVCCGQVNWTDVQTIRRVSRIGRCQTCGRAVGIVLREAVCQR